jgi:hypothetical protein
MSADFQVTITDPERRRNWLLWLGTDTVCVRSPVASRVRIEGLGERLGYILDAEQLSEEKRLRLARGIAQTFRASLSGVVQWMMGDGIVILAEHCSVTVLNPQRWV